MLGRCRRSSTLIVLVLALVMLAAIATVASATLTTSWSRSYWGPVDYRTDTEAQMVVDSAFASVSALDGTHAWAVGSTQEWEIDGAGDLVGVKGPVLPFVGSTSNGVDWSVGSLPAFTGALYGADAFDSTHVWAVGDAGLILNWGGSAWVRQGQGVTSAALRAVSFSDADNGWAVGDGGVILRTVNGGATWTVSSSGTSVDLSAVSAPAAGSAFAVGTGGNIGRWNGSSWQFQPVSPYRNLRGVDAADATHAWAVGAANTFLRWDGSAWAAGTAPVVSGFAASNMKPCAVSFSSTLDGIAVGDYSIVWRTADGGANWEPAQLPLNISRSHNVALLGVATAPGLASRAWSVGYGDPSGATPDAYVYLGALSAPPAPYTITSSVTGAHGTISPLGAQLVPPAGSLAFSVTPDPGYHVASVLVDGGSVGTPTSYTFPNVSANHTIAASFAVNTLPEYTLTYTAGTGGTISGTSPQTVQQGSSGTQVTAVPNAGYHFVKWSDDVMTPARTDANVTADKSVTATFAINTYTLTYSAGTGGTISGTTPQTVNHGASGTQVTANSNAGYHFVKWSDDVMTPARTDANVTADKSVTATFAINTYTLTYSAGTGGTISGTTPQTVNHGASGTQVTANPNDGYHFVKWSDDVMTASRTDAGVTADKSVTATFAVNVVSDLRPVYRFYNLRTGVHFYTASETEKEYVQATYPTIYRFEGVAYNINVANPANNAPLFRFYNVKKGVHFYTASVSERDYVQVTYPTIYRYEGPAWNVSNSSAGGAASVFRFYNLKQGVHFYTASVSERDYVQVTYRTIYRYEGVSYYLAP